MKVLVYITLLQEQDLLNIATWTNTTHMSNYITACYANVIIVMISNLYIVYMGQLIIVTLIMTVNDHICTIMIMTTSMIMYLSSLFMTTSMIINYCIA